MMPVRNRKDLTATITFIVIVVIMVAIVLGFSYLPFYVGMNADMHNAATQVQRQK